MLYWRQEDYQLMDLRVMSFSDQSFKHHKAGCNGDTKRSFVFSFKWRHNERDGVSDHKRLDIVYSTVCSGADQRKHESLASLALWGKSTGQRRIP